MKRKIRAKSKVRKEIIEPEKIELLIPGAEFEQTCTEDLIQAFKEIPPELKPRKRKREKQ